MGAYDLNDPYIRELVRGHIPTEVFSTNGGTDVTIKCVRCNQPWPCEARQAYLAWEAEQQKIAEAALEAAAGAQRDAHLQQRSELRNG